MDTLMADRQFIADSTIAVLRPDKEAAEYGKKNGNEEGTIKKSPVGNPGRTSIFRINILHDRYIYAGGEHK